MNKRKIRRREESRRVDGQDPDSQRIMVITRIHRSVVKFILFLEGPLDFEQQGVEFGPIGHVLSESTVFSCHSMLNNND